MSCCCRRWVHSSVMKCVPCLLRSDSKCVCWTLRIERVERIVQRNVRRRCWGLHVALVCGRVTYPRLKCVCCALHNEHVERVLSSVWYAKDIEYCTLQWSMKKWHTLGKCVCCTLRIKHVERILSSVLYIKDIEGCTLHNMQREHNAECDGLPIVL